MHGLGQSVMQSGGCNIGRLIAQLPSIKALELKQKQQERLDVHVPLERLTSEEQDLYFQLSMELMSEGEMVDFSEDNVPVY